MKRTASPLLFGLCVLSLACGAESSSPPSGETDIAASTGAHGSTGGTADPSTSAGTPSSSSSSSDSTQGEQASTGTMDPVAGLGVPTLLTAAVGGCEGPVWVDALDALLLSNIQQDRLFQVTVDGVASEYLSPSDRTNGLAVDPGTGDILLCQMGLRQVARRSLDGSSHIALATDIDGTPFNAPNDLAVRNDGTLYFTDPTYGLSQEEQLLGHNSLYRVALDLTLSIAWEGTASDLPNGVALSPDERHLYMVNAAGDVPQILQFSVAADGSLGDPQTFAATPSGTDGLCVDVQGNIYSVSGEGLGVYAPDGSVWGTVPMSTFEGSARLTNCAFGGPDRTDLFVTTASALYHLSAIVPGHLAHG